MSKHSNERNKNVPMMNGDVTRRYAKCVLIDSDGINHGVISTDAAMDMAEKRGLDLVLVGNHGSDVPTCRITNWSKEEYRRQKRERANRRNAPKDTKQMKFRAKIGDGDMEHKMRQVNKFLDDGHRCILTVMFRGRETTHPEIGEDVLMRAVGLANGHGTMVSKPRMSSTRDMSVTLVPSKNPSRPSNREE